jgi:hypothetical protein
MRITFECSQFVVFDDVMPERELEEIWRYLQFVTLPRVDSVYDQDSPWPISDGGPLTGEPVLAAAEPSELLRRADGEAPAGPAYPTGTALDYVFGKLLCLLPQIEAWVGKAGKDWNRISASPYVYPSGTALSWHADGSPLTGAFTFYAHPVWKAQWGGELLVAHRSRKLPYSGSVTPDPHSLEEKLRYRFDKRAMNEHLSRPGVGRFIMAIPNRLVVLTGGNPHKVARVDPSAGDRVRATISGFFLRSETTAGHRKRSAKESAFTIELSPEQKERIRRFVGRT